MTLFWLIKFKILSEDYLNNKEDKKNPVALSALGSS